MILLTHLTESDSGSGSESASASDESGSGSESEESGEETESEEEEEDERRKRKERSVWTRPKQRNQQRRAQRGAPSTHHTKSMPIISSDQLVLPNVSCSAPSFP